MNDWQGIVGSSTQSDVEAQAVLRQALRDSFADLRLSADERRLFRANFASAKGVGDDGKA